MLKHRAAVIGSPVAHSLSPVLHGAAYAALGLPGWDYTRIECGTGELAALLDRVSAEESPRWAGFSVTMPLKRVALDLAVSSSDLATDVGAANTLTPVPGGWHADNTDVDGILGALAEAGVADVRQAGARRAVVLGAGGTAAAALAALRQLGVAEPAVVVRDPARAADLGEAAARLGVRPQLLAWADAEKALLDAEVVISTVPAGAADGLVGVQWQPDVAVLDVVYHPWPSPLAAAAAATGARIASGLDMLLHQACRQVELMTGHEAPLEAMRRALDTAVSRDEPHH